MLNRPKAKAGVIVVWATLAVAGLAVLATGWVTEEGRAWTYFGALAAYAAAVLSLLVGIACARSFRSGAEAQACYAGAPMSGAADGLRRLLLGELALGAAAH